MMKQMLRIIILSICFFIKKADAQNNLVPNYSFEFHTSCPNNTITDIGLAFPWFNPTVNASPYFNSCSTNPGAGVPCNWAGCQYPRTGNAYADIVTLYGTPDGRGYIETPLLDTLIKGKKYCVQMYVSLSEISVYATNNLGVYFSKDSIYDYTTLYYLSYIPQVEHTSIITMDTVNWVQISGELIAGGGKNLLP